MKPIGYRSTVYGDDTTKLIKVFELDEDEKLSQEIIKNAKARIDELEHKQYREKLKPSEIGKRAELKAAVEELQAGCRHRVFKDEAGFIYDLRSCVTCGTHMGTV